MSEVSLVERARQYKFAIWGKSNVRQRGVVVVWSLGAPQTQGHDHAAENMLGRHTNQGLEALAGGSIPNAAGRE